MAECQKEKKCQGCPVLIRLTMKLKKYFLTIVIAMLLIVTTAWQVQIIEILLPKKGGQAIAVLRIHSKDIIKLSYRHSNELIQVEGRFTIDAQSRLRALDTRFESTGSGLPVSFPERTKRDGKWLVVDEMNKEVGTIRFYIVPVNQTRLVVGKHPILLSKLKSGTLIEIKASHVSNIKYLLKTWSLQ